jgi:hypothetical protein
VSLRNKLPEHCRNFLTPYDAAHYKGEGTKTFGMKLGTGAIGYTLSKDGDFGGFYNTSGVKGAGANCLIEAIGHGAKTMDCIGDGLSAYYKWFGFEEVKRDKWNPEYAPKDWETDPLTKGTTPDIVYMKFTGASRDPETVRKLYEEHRSGKGAAGEGRPKESGRPGASGGADGGLEGRYQRQVGNEKGTPQRAPSARVVKGYDPLPTAGECAQFAKDKLGIEADYKHLDPETANAINRALFLEKQTLGSVSFSKIGTTITLPEHNNLSKGKPHGMLMQTWWDRYSAKNKPELQINVGAMNRWLPRVPKGKRLGFHVADSAGNRQRGLIAAVTHEVGHSMWLKLSPHDRRTFTKVAQNEMNNLFASAGGDVEVHVPSDYAATSVAEMWAECFAAYQTGLAVDKVPPKVLKILKHNFKKAAA